MVENEKLLIKNYAKYLIFSFLFSIFCLVFVFDAFASSPLLPQPNFLSPEQRWFCYQFLPIHS
jgi:hypothetical protein